MRAGRRLRQAVLLMLLAANAGPAPAADDPYAAGVAAFEQEDWQAVLEHMNAALEARPRQENAHILMGFAYGKLGDYPAALEAYDRALTLNPYNRGALEYLGEAYLELDRPDDARATLDRLATACRRLAHAAVDPLTTCAEWQELSEAYEAYLANDPSATPD
jgi:tetratricopeptide (TPR) repeat protein